MKAQDIHSESAVRLAEGEPVPPAAYGFEDLIWLFQCDSRNRGIIRQGFDEAALLWKAVKATAGDILEVGRNRAGSTSLLAAASLGRAIYSLDIRSKHHPSCEEFLRRTAQDRVYLLVADSRQPLPGRIFGLLFIDGDHSFEAVLADTIAHWNALQAPPGYPGLAAFHDAVPNQNFVWRDQGRHWHSFWTRLKNKFRKEQKSEMARDYEIGVYALCSKLIDEKIAEPWDRAGSMLVLSKIRDLPQDFARMFTQKDFQAAAAAALKR